MGARITYGIVMRVFVFLVVVLSTISLRADVEPQMDNLKHDYNHVGKPVAPFTPCAGPLVRRGMDINLSAEFLYWSTRLDTLTYAKTGFRDTVNDVSPNKGEVQMVDWSWDPGFKVGLGWSFDHGCWDMRLVYTWFYTNVGDRKRSNSMVPGFAIIEPSIVSSGAARFVDAHAHFDLHYQVSDLELGRNYYVSRTLKLRPFVGMKGTWQKQDYATFFNSSSVSGSTSNYKARFDHSLWGLGMRAGLKTSWQFSRHFSLYGDFALTGMWLHYDINRKDTSTDYLNGEQAGAKRTMLNIQGRLRIVKPVLEWAIGLRAESYFSCQRCHVLLQAGWESHIWANQTLYISADNYFDRFDLSLQGLAAQLRLSF